MSGLPLRWTLRRFLFGLGMLSAIVPLAVISTLGMSILFPHLNDRDREAQSALAQSISAQVEAYLLQAGHELQQLALLQRSLPSLQAAETMDEVTDWNPLFSVIYRTDDVGLVTTVGLPLERRYLRENFLRLDMSRKDFFVEAKNSGENVWSGAFLSPISGQLTVAHVIPLNGQLLIGEIAIDRLPHMVEFMQATRGYSVMILDSRGQLLAHPDQSLNNQQLNLRHIALVERAYRNGEATDEFSLFGERYLGSVIRSDETGWLIAVSRPLSQHYYTSDTALWMMLVSLLASILVALLLAVVIGRHFSRRFQVYTEYARNMLTGQPKRSPVQSPIIEFNELGADLYAAGQVIQHREAAILRREERYRTLVEQSPVAVVEWDVDLNIKVWNESAELMFGYSADETIGQGMGFLELSSHRSLFASFLDEFQYRSRFEREVQLRAKDGRKLICRAANTTIRSGDGALLGYLSLVEDITEQRSNEREIRLLNAELEARVTARTEDLSNSNRQLKSALESLKRTQSELVRSEKLASLGALVAGVAHELNTPIGNALMAVTALQSDSRHTRNEFLAGQIKRSTLEQYLEQGHHAEQIIVRNLERASTLIASFKQVASDQTSSHSRLFMLDQQVDEVLLTLMPTLRTSGVKVTCDIPDNLSLNSYPGPLGQVITNLINNAVIHAFDGEPGTVRILATLLPERQVHIDIKDDGKGIAAENIDKIFDPFFSTRMGQGGTGLGLHIVHNIVCNVLGGSITVSSDEHGTCFRLQIPLDAPATEQPALLKTDV